MSKNKEEIYKIVLKKGEGRHTKETSYRKRRPIWAEKGHVLKITIDHTKVPSTQYDFPVLITEAHMPDHFWENVKPDGSNIAVYQTSDSDWWNQPEPIKIIKHRGRKRHTTRITKIDE